MVGGCCSCNIATENHLQQRGGENQQWNGSCAGGAPGSSGRSAELNSAVSRNCIPHAGPQGGRAPDCLHALPSATRRSGRLQICATENPVVRTSRMECASWLPERIHALHRRNLLPPALRDSGTERIAAFPVPANPISAVAGLADGARPWATGKSPVPADKNVCPTWPTVYGRATGNDGLQAPPKHSNRV
jgi:hypothetical protein